MGPERFARSTHGVRTRHDPISPQTRRGRTIASLVPPPGIEPGPPVLQTGAQTTYARVGDGVRRHPTSSLFTLRLSKIRPPMAPLTQALSRHTCHVRRSMCGLCRPRSATAVREQGLEPRVAGPKPAVLPLDHSRSLGAPGGNRTPNVPVKSRLRCQLHQGHFLAALGHVTEADGHCDCFRFRFVCCIDFLSCRWLCRMEDAPVLSWGQKDSNPRTSGL